MTTEREFNIFGPIYPHLHYHVDRVEAKVELRKKIEKGRYFTLTASRQTGKTTIFREIIAELTATGEYFGILLNFEAYVYLEEPKVYEELARTLAKWQKYYEPTAPKPESIASHPDFTRWLSNVSEQLQKKCVLIIDEYEALPTDITIPLLSQFRNLYMQRNEPYETGPHSILLVGVQTIPSLLGGTQSPFNIADQHTVPYFTEDEAKILLLQHTEATGQVFEEDVIRRIYEQSEGQPYLVNRLGKMLTEEMKIAVDQPITRKDLDKALMKLVNEDNTHFASIQSKAELYRSEVVRTLFEGTRYYDFRDKVVRDLIMYGVLRVVPDDNEIEYARIANRIYQKVLIKAFAPSHQLITGTTSRVYPRYIIEEYLNFDGLLDSFKAFMEEYGLRLIKSETTQRPLEISGQYLLLSYLTAAFQSIGGYVTIEPQSTAGELDILALYQDQRFIVEVKVWYGTARYEAAQQQLKRYLEATGLPKGYLVVFDEKIEQNPVVLAEGDVFELVVDDKVLRVYLIGVSV
ncbi:MAG: AAA-like domain-containing protein [Chloroflexota bacterium]